VVLLCFVTIPLVAAFVSKRRLGWVIVGVTPFVTIGACFFYMEILHWDGLPRWLIDRGNVTSIHQCEANLKQLEGAKAWWALEHGKSTNDVPAWEDLIGSERYISNKPKCSLDGAYILGRVGEPARCSIPEHNQ
jgi:hypothetical protein